MVGTVNNANYQGLATNTLVIGKATATVTLGSLSQTYDGTAKTVTATTAPASLTVNFTYAGSVTAPTAAGSYTVVGTVNNANYQGAATNTLVIGKATATVTTWPTATAITYGQTLAAATLSGGAASVAGSFAFTTPGTAPAAGTTVQAVTFTPTDSANYNLVSGTVSVTVNKATPTVTTWPAATAITYGQTLAAATLSGGTASVAGSFAFTTPGTAPAAGTAAQGVTFTPTDTANFSPATSTVSVTVAPATLTITAPNRTKTYGQAVTFVGTEFTTSALPNSETVGSVTLTSSGAVATAGVSGSPFGIVPSAATGGTFNPANYAISYQNGALRVDLAALTVTADNKVRVYGATNPVFTGTIIGVQNSDSITADYACTATPASPSGPYEIVPTLLDPTGKLGNYSVTTNNGVLTVVSEPAIVNPTWAGSSFSLTVPTAVGLNYALEYKESLEDLLWAIAQTLSGTGSTITLTDGMATNTARFYRVRVE